MDLATNRLLWLGKDYGNLIAKDWIKLDKPFEGAGWTRMGSPRALGLGVR